MHGDHDRYFTHIYPLSGAAARVATSDTTWAAREGGFVQTIAGVDPDPANARLVTSLLVVMQS